jgi:predicted nucleic acid-binding protein
MERSNTPQTVVSDAGPLIHLDELGCLNLLSDFPVVLVATEVQNEVQKHQPDSLRLPNLRVVQAGISTSSQLETLTQVLSLHAGELEALRIAQEHPGCLFLTDDTAARLAAQKMGFFVHGTIGILLRALRRRQRSKEEILETLRRMPTASTLHVRSDLLKTILDRVELF